MRRLLRALSRLGLVAGVAAVVYKVIQRRAQPPLDRAEPVAWPPIAVPEEPAPALAGNGLTPPSDEAPAPAEVPTHTWVPPDEDSCPASHPVKAKLASGVFHLPGMLHYDRTKPDRCYPDPASAEADGLRQAKR